MVRSLQVGVGGADQMPDAIIVAIGVGAIVLVLVDVFLIIAPQASLRGMSWNRTLSKLLWPAWLAIGVRVTNPLRREPVLAAFAPSFIAIFLLLWLTLLIFGYGCIFFGLRDQLRPTPSFGGAVYFAGISILTIGYGDIVPTEAASRVIAILAGATGVGVFSLATALLFALFGSFRARERFVLYLGTRSSRPISGVTLIESYARAGTLDRFSGLLSTGEDWAASILDTHLAYPELVFFRSSDTQLSWVGSLVALLDASTLLVTTVRGADAAEAPFMIELGRYIARMFSLYFTLSKNAVTPMERATFDRGLARLSGAGVDTYDPGEAWIRFSAIRSSYIGPLAVLGRRLAVPCGDWTDDPVS